MNWRDEALCQNEQSDLFFPIGRTGPAIAQIEAAKEVCGQCPVQARCLEWALTHGVDHGVWGGLSEDERRLWKRRERRKRSMLRMTPVVRRSSSG